MSNDLRSRGSHFRDISVVSGKQREVGPQQKNDFDVSLFEIDVFHSVFDADYGCHVCVVMDSLGAPVTSPEDA